MVDLKNNINKDTSTFYITNLNYKKNLTTNLSPCKGLTREVILLVSYFWDVYSITSRNGLSLSKKIPNHTSKANRVAI